MATSEVSHLEGNYHRHVAVTRVVPRFHTEHSKLRMGVIQVLNCELPKYLSTPPMQYRVLVRNLIDESWSRVTCRGSLLNFIVKYAYHLCKW